MIDFTSFISAINATLGNFKFLLFAETCSLFIKLYIFVSLLVYSLKTKKSHWLVKLLLLVLIGATLSNVTWILRIIKNNFIFSIDARLYIFTMRLAWAFAVVQYQSFSLFVENTAEPKPRIKISHIPFLLVSGCLIIAFLYFAVFNFNIYQTCDRSPLEFSIAKRTHHYLIFLMFMSALKSLRKLRNGNLPVILEHQLKAFISYLIIPYIFVDLFQYFPLSQNSSGPAISNYASVGISTTLLTFMIFYFTRKVMGLRFLNLSDHVYSKHNFDFITDFKDILEDLGKVTNIRELTHITQSFFKSAFSIPTNRTKLYLRKLNKHQEESDHNDLIDTAFKVESFLLVNNTNDSQIMLTLRQKRVLIKNELEFSNFYEENLARKNIIEFLGSINSDIFLPVFEKNNIVGYIIIEKDSRPNKLFSSIERDEMLVFASYLGNTINLLKHRDLDRLMQQEKELKEEIYNKHQEINQYKEAIKSFLRANKDRKIGIVFYKNNRFSMANLAAQELIGINPNDQTGEPIAQALKKLVRQIQEYRSAQTIFSKDASGTKIVLAGIPSLDTNLIIVLVYYPEISDLLRSQLDVLKDPSQWDYLLYLETTNTGRLINSVLPSSSPQFLNFKIELLKTSLSKKATLLSMPEDDLLPTVEMLHHISLRQNLHIIKLTAPEKNNEFAIKLFGLNPLLGSIEMGEPILSKLNNIGTLFIENIHFLNLETQKQLADFIIYGFYKGFKSDTKHFSDVRIIASTTQNLQTLVQEGKFLEKLFNELSKMSLSLPSLLNLSKGEIGELADGFTEAAIKTQTFKNFFELNDKDKDKIYSHRSLSLKEFKNIVHQMLVDKSTKNKIYETTEFDPAYSVSDPELVEAVRLGKKALKDPKIMSMLWYKFKNQNKIATLLSVNRSSINRRLKEFNIF